MHSVLCMNQNEQEDMLAGLGIRGAHLRKTLQGNQLWPYCISQVSDENASILLDHYGKTLAEVDRFAHSVKATGEMVARMVAEYLHIRRVEKVLLLEGGELLIFPDLDITETKEIVIYGGYVRNVVTKEYERLFSTEFSALLACNRAREAAIRQNGAINRLKAEYEKKGGGELWHQFLNEHDRNGNPNVAFYRLGKRYDIDDIVVQARRSIVTTVSGEWSRPSEKDINATKNAVIINMKNGLVPRFDFEQSEGD